MSGKIYHPEEKHPEPYQQDLGPDASKGLNYGLEGADIQTRTAVDIKEFHKYLQDFTPDELRQMEVLQYGARLETKATYIYLADEHPMKYKRWAMRTLETTTITSLRRTFPTNCGTN